MLEREGVSEGVTLVKRRVRTHVVPNLLLVDGPLDDPPVMIDGGRCTAADPLLRRTRRLHSSMLGSVPRSNIEW